MLQLKLLRGITRNLQQITFGTGKISNNKNVGGIHKPMLSRSYACKGLKVTICGAGGQTGQPLALLLKQSPLIDELALYDICSTCGCGMELSHVDTKCRVCAYSGRGSLLDALQDANVVIMVARNVCDSFENSAPIVCELALQQCNVCPDAFTIVATEPVESMTPLTAEIQRLRCVYNPRKLLGCVELHSVRANTVLADFLRVQPEGIRVPVIGGATPETMVPVLSAAVHPGNMSQEQIECICSSIMGGNAAICAAKGCPTATPCLAGAYAVARTTINVIKAIQGQKDVVQLAYVDNLRTCCPDCQFFTSEVVLGPSGVEKNLGIPELTKFENCLLAHVLPYVRTEQARAFWLVYSICMQQSMNMYCACTSPNSCYSTGYRPSPCGPGPCGPCRPCGPCVPCGPCGTCGPCGQCQPCGPCRSCYQGDCSNLYCYQDPCIDEYLASICREMTCKCGSCCLTWRPRDCEFDESRAGKSKHQMLVKCAACEHRKAPRSLRLAEAMKERACQPCHGF